MANTASKAEKVWIPDVPDEVIRELAERIKPVCMFEGVKRYIEPVDIFGIAYTWNPVPAAEATGLTPLCVITTYHSWAYYGIFKPSIAEVLAQIPMEHRDAVAAFEIIKSPAGIDDLNREKEAMNAGYHVAETQLYVRA